MAKRPKAANYIFTHQGMVQLYRAGDRCGMLVATNYPAAKTLANIISKPGRRVSIATLGIVDGETLEGQFRAATIHGASGLYVTSDGKQLKFATPD